MVNQDHNALIKETLTINKVLSFEAAQQSFISTRARESDEDIAAKTIKLDLNVNLGIATHKQLAEKLERYETLESCLTDLDREVKVLEDDDLFYKSLEEKRETYFNNFVLRSSEIKYDNLVIMGLTDPHKSQEQILDPLSQISTDFIIERQSDSKLGDVLKVLMAYILDFAAGFIPALREGPSENDSRNNIVNFPRTKPPQPIVQEEEKTAIAA